MRVRFTSAIGVFWLVLTGISGRSQSVGYVRFVDPIIQLREEVSRLSPPEISLLQRSAQSGERESQLKFGLACEMRYAALGISFAEGQRRAVEWFQKAANQNNALGQRMFAASLTGNWAEMRQWYERAARQGDIASAYSLGQLYLDGNLSGKPEPSEAARWFLIAAKGGDIEAAFKIGCFYESGSGVERNAGEAAKWYRRAAESGWKAAQYKLGTLYEQGTGVDQDYQAAAKWYSEAADRSGDAAYHYARLIASHRITDKSSVDAQEMFRRATKLYRIDAKLGDTGAAQTLAKMFEDGMGVAQSYSEALFWYSFAKGLGAEVDADVTRVKSHLSAGQVGRVKRRLERSMSAPGE